MSTVLLLVTTDRTVLSWDRSKHPLQSILQYLEQDLNKIYTDENDRLFARLVEYKGFMSEETFIDMAENFFYGSDYEYVWVSSEF